MLFSIRSDAAENMRARPGPMDLVAPHASHGPERVGCSCGEPIEGARQSTGARPHALTGRAKAITPQDRQSGPNTATRSPLDRPSIAPIAFGLRDLMGHGPPIEFMFRSGFVHGLCAFVHGIPPGLTLTPGKNLWLTGALTMSKMVTRRLRPGRKRRFMPDSDSCRTAPYVGAFLSDERILMECIFVRPFSVSANTSMFFPRFENPTRTAVI